MKNLVRALVAGSVLIACIGDSPNQVPDAGVDGGGDASCGTVGLGCCSGNQCSGGAMCTGGACTCAQPQTACGASCANLQTDEKNCGQCSHDCLGGTCTGGVCQPTTLATNQAVVADIVVTPTRVFWVRGVINSQVAGVFSADLDGKNPTTLYQPAAGVACAQLAVASTDAYFRCNAQIQRCALPSCGSGPAVVLAQAGVTGLAFDATNDRVYFTVGTPYNQQTGGFIASVPRLGGSSARLVAADQPQPNSPVIDQGIVYWLDSGTYLTDLPQHDGGVRRAPLGTNQSVTVVTADANGFDYGSLSLQGTNLRWVANIGTGWEMHGVSTAGGPTATYTPAVNKTMMRRVVADASYVYWSEDGVGLYRCEKNCIKPALLAGNQTVLALAQDATAIYWSADTNEIHRLAK